MRNEKKLEKRKRKEKEKEKRGNNLQAFGIKKERKKGRKKEGAKKRRWDSWSFVARIEARNLVDNQQGIKKETCYSYLSR